MATQSFTSNSGEHRKSCEEGWRVWKNGRKESPGEEGSSSLIRSGGSGFRGSSSSSIGNGEEKMGFTPALWHEFQEQFVIYRHISSGLPVPFHLVLPIWKSVAASLGTTSGGIFQLYPSFMGLGPRGFDIREMMDPEPGRCRRTDGKKWRCSRNSIPEEKYCELHMHRGRGRSRKHVEAAQASSSSPKRPENSNSGQSVSVGLQLMTQPSRTTEGSICDDGKKRTKYASAPFVNAGATYGNLTAPTPATAVTAVRALSSSPSSQTTGKCLSGKNCGNIRDCSFRETSNKNMNINAANPISPGLSFSPISVLPVGSSNGLALLELERCRRTDGKKWRCSRKTVADQKYCVTHMHRGAKMQRDCAPALAAAACRPHRTTSISSKTDRSSPNTNLSISIQVSSLPMTSDEKTHSSSDSDATITDTSIHAYAISKASSADDS
ncbi:hypothetical protein UlMin_021587 [Ulmus minor]